MNKFSKIKAWSKDVHRIQFHLNIAEQLLLEEPHKGSMISCSGGKQWILTRLGCHFFQ